MKSISFFFLLFLSSALLAQDSIFSVSFGPVQLGKSRVPLDLKDFKVSREMKTKLIKAGFIKGSVQWVRNSSNLLTPRARLGILIYSSEPSFHIEYLGRKIIPQKRGKNLYTELYVNLFNPEVMKVIDKNTVIEKISSYTDISNKKKNTKLIDYSCVNYALDIIGLDNEYMSIGCRLERVGTWGSEKPYLEVTWSATNIKLINGQGPPFTTFLKNSEPTEFFVLDQEGKKKKVLLKARLPKRLKRLKLAYGFGPAGLLAETPTEKREWKAAPVFYLYGKLDFTRHTSIRIFDALAYNKATFNNSGFYFAYQLADALDGRLEIVPLLGVQGLYFDYGNGGQKQNDLIYPQGFEINYKNAFGIERYLLSFGLFLSTQDNVDYTNSWVRWGKGPFWEFNYITWGQNGYVSKMAGLSVGLPLASFF